MYMCHPRRNRNRWIHPPRFYPRLFPPYLISPWYNNTAHVHHLISQLTMPHIVLTPTSNPPTTALAAASVAASSTVSAAPPATSQEEAPASRPRSNHFVQAMLRPFRRAPARTLAEAGGQPPTALRPYLSSRQTTYHPDHQLKPIYIYPGLLRIVRDKAIALDNQCPAVLYKCRECKRTREKSSTTTDPTNSPHNTTDPTATPTDGSLTDLTALPEAVAAQGQPTPKVQCPHQTSCSICLDEFHDKDLVRKLPCNVNHVFHSKCILDWFVSHHRCPLCNKAVAPSLPPPAPPTVPARSPASHTSTEAIPSRSPRHNSSTRFHRRVPSDFLPDARRVRSSRPQARQRSDVGLLVRLRASRSRRSTEEHAARRNSTRNMSPQPVSSSSSSSSLLMPRSSRSQGWLRQRPMSTPSSLTPHASTRSDPVQEDLVHQPDQSSVPEGGTGVGDGHGERSSCRNTTFSRHAGKEVSGGEKTKKKTRGPRTYSYIVHDSVRMEMNPVIPVWG